MTSGRGAVAASHSAGTWTRHFAALLRSALAPPGALHVAVRIGRCAAAGRARAVDVARVVLRAIADAALDVAVLIADGAASRPRAEHFAVLIDRTLSLAANDVAILVLDALGGIGSGGREKQPTDEDNGSGFHRDRLFQ